MSSLCAQVLITSLPILFFTFLFQNSAEVLGVTISAGAERANIYKNVWPNTPCIDKNELQNQKLGLGTPALPISAEAKRRWTRINLRKMPTHTDTPSCRAEKGTANTCSPIAAMPKFALSPPPLQTPVTETKRPREDFHFHVLFWRHGV